MGFDSRHGAEIPGRRLSPALLKFAYGFGLLEGKIDIIESLQQTVLAKGIHLEAQGSAIWLRD